MLILRSLLSCNENRYGCFSFTSNARWEWESAGYMHYWWYSLYCFHCSFISNIIFNLNYSAHSLFILISFFSSPSFCARIFHSFKIEAHLMNRLIGTATDDDKKSPQPKHEMRTEYTGWWTETNLNSKSMFFMLRLLRASPLFQSHGMIKKLEIWFRYVNLGNTHPKTLIPNTNTALTRKIDEFCMAIIAFVMKSHAMIVQTTVTVWRIHWTNFIVQRNKDPHGFHVFIHVKAERAH